MVSAPILHGIAAHTSPCAVKLGQSVNMEPTIVRTGSPLSVSRVPFPSSVSVVTRWAKAITPTQKALVAAIFYPSN